MKPFLLHPFYVFLFGWFSFTSCTGQNPVPVQAAFPEDVAEQIKLVENNLAGRLKIEGQPWNILDRMAYYKFNGVSIAVIHDYKVVWAKGYGWADVTEKIPVTGNTLFQAASVSKSINSMGVLKLAQEQKLDLNADINQYLNSWKFPYDATSKGKKITPLNLLNHTAGISGSAPEYVFKDTIPSLIQTLNGTAAPSRYVYSRVEPARSVIEPGTRYQYSNNGIGITQLLVSDITQQAYEQYIAKTVFEPLGMLHSGYSPSLLTMQQKQLASGYQNGMEIPGKHVIIPAIAAGGLWTTPSDLAKFIIELQLSFFGHSNKVLSREMTSRMLTPVLDSVAPGVFIRQINDTEYFGHSGSLPGFNCEYYGSMEGGNGVVVMVNSGNSSDFIQEIIHSVAFVYKWKDFYRPVTKKAVRVPDTILQKYTGVYTLDENRFTIILKKGSGYSLYADGVYDPMYFSNETDFFNVRFETEKHFLKDASGNVSGYTRTLYGDLQRPDPVKIVHPEALTRNEMFFGTVGWVYLEHQLFKDALVYLKRGVELYPESRMLKMNLAHAYLFNDDFETALNIYRTHLHETVNGNTSWKEMLLSDFVFFKNNQCETSRMLRALKELKVNAPEGFDH